MQETEQSEAFSAFYRKNVQFVYGIALAYLRNPQDAEDATADVFVKLLEQDITFPDEARARAWLSTAVRNRCKNHLKSWFQSRRADIELDDTEAGGEESDRLKDTLAAIQRLPDKYRVPLVLFAVQGYSAKETAAILNMKESTVLTRISRARTLLRGLLEEDIL